METKNPIDKRMVEFIRKHHVFTLATSNENKPYTCSCFYVYLETENLFIFTSDHKTKHIGDIEKNKLVAGALALETNMIGKIQGIQFTGIISKLEGGILNTATSAYLKKFPIAHFKDLLLWGVEPDFFKMTDNRLGFGKKLIWKKEE